jgi:hypothetical protein
MNASNTSLPVLIRNGDGLPKSATEILTACFPRLLTSKELRTRLFFVPEVVSELLIQYFVCF